MNNNLDILQDLKKSLSFLESFGFEFKGDGIDSSELFGERLRLSYSVEAKGINLKILLSNSSGEPARFTVVIDSFSGGSVLLNDYLVENNELSLLKTFINISNTKDINTFFLNFGDSLKLIFSDILPSFSNEEFWKKDHFDWSEYK